MYTKLFICLDLLELKTMWLTYHWSMCRRNREESFHWWLNWSNLRDIIYALPWLLGLEMKWRSRPSESIDIFQTEDVMLSILRRGPWSFKVDLHWWHPQQTDDEIHHISFSVEVRGMPNQFLTQKIVSHIGHTMGLFLETDYQGDGNLNVD